MRQCDEPFCLVEIVAQDMFASVRRGGCNARTLAPQRFDFGSDLDVIHTFSLKQLLTRGKRRNRTVESSKLSLYGAAVLSPPGSELPIFRSVESIVVKNHGISSKFSKAALGSGFA